MCASQNKLYSGNDDKDVVYHSGISLVIAATKYDAFRDAEPEVKKVRCGTHTHIHGDMSAQIVYRGADHTHAGLTHGTHTDVHTHARA